MVPLKRRLPPSHLWAARGSSGASSGVEAALSESGQPGRHADDSSPAGVSSRRVHLRGERYQLPAKWGADVSARASPRFVHPQKPLLARSARRASSRAAAHSAGGEAFSAVAEDSRTPGSVSESV